METITLNFKASGQNLTADAHTQRYASNTVNYIQAVFDLDENWQSFDSVRAVWHNDFACISTVLDSDGACTVPHEVLSNLDEVQVNLVGSVVDGDELTDRMTTYPLQVAVIDADALICGTETTEVTPSQFEQFIAQVAELVGSVKDIDRIELNDDYTLTVYFSDGTSWTSTSIRGEQGETGNGIESAVLNDDYTLTLTFTDGTEYTTPSIRGPQGPQGEPGEVTLAQLESVLPTDTASGAIASFPDGSDLFDYLSCVVSIEPLQDLHGYDSPWVGGAGKNKWSDKLSDYSRPNDYYWFPISLEVGETYTWSASRFGSSVTGVTVGIVKDGVRYSEFVTPSPWRLVGNDGNIVESSITFTIDNTWTSPKVVIYAANEETFNNFFANYHLQFEKSATATAWQPYSNICPISGRSSVGVNVRGFNLWDEVWEEGYIAPSTGQNSSASNRIRSKNYIPVKGGESYYFKCGSGKKLGLFAYDANETYIGCWSGGTWRISTGTTDDGNAVIAVPQNCAFLRFICLDSYGGTYLNDISINYPSTDTTYHAHNPESSTHTIPLGTTVYGGTVDLVTGVLTVMYGGRDMGSLTWNNYKSGGFRALLPNSVQATLSTDDKRLRTTMYQTQASNATLTNGQASIAGGNLHVVNGNFTTDANAFKTAMTGQIAVYELATPTTYQLTPTQIHALLGQNNVWADCGNVEVKYKADVQRWVEKMLNA